MDVESFEEGFLAKIIFNDGASAPVGATVALLAKTKEDIPAVQAMTGSSGGAAAAPAAAAPGESNTALDDPLLSFPSLDPTHLRVSPPSSFPSYLQLLLQLPLLLEAPNSM